MSADYVHEFDDPPGACMVVEFTSERREITDYAVILVRESGTRTETIRVYDSAHGQNEMHRYTSSGGKQPGTQFHSGTLGEGMRAAIKQVKAGHLQMIEGWKGNEQTDW